MPFGDMKAMIDPPTADLAGRLLEMMGTFGYEKEFGRAQRAIKFLTKFRSVMVHGGDAGASITSMAPGRC